MELDFVVISSGLTILATTGVLLGSLYFVYKNVKESKPEE